MLTLTFRRSRQPGRYPPRQRAPQQRDDRVRFDCSGCKRAFSKPADTPEFEAKCRSCGRQAYRAGIAKFECACGNDFTGVGRLDITSPCYKCSRSAPAVSIRPFSKEIRPRSNLTHSCALCAGGGHCPLYARASAE